MSDVVNYELWFYCVLVNIVRDFELVNGNLYSNKWFLEISKPDIYTPNRLQAYE